MGEVFKREKNGKSLGFYLRWYEGGKRRVLASKQASHLDAKRMLLEIEARVARGEVGIPERRVSWLTVSELIERFLGEYSRPRIKNIDTYRSQARTILRLALPSLGAFAVNRVWPADVAKLRDGLARKYAPATVRGVLAFVGVVFAWAMRNGLAPHNPCKGIEKPTAKNALDFLGRNEVKLLLKTVAQRADTALMARMLHVGVACVVHTGLRKGELLGLRWQDVDLETRRLTVARSYRGTPKSGKTRHMRLPEALVPVLSGWRSVCPSSQDGSVLPVGLDATKVGTRDAMLGLREVMASAGLPSFRHPWHALRHTFASHFVMNGGNILALSKILGHSDTKMSMLYAHLAPDFLDGEMNRVKF